ncbi:hypothetical protein EYB26_001623 [Talaromyces marneffei]|uniref:uncharacterized protein n=1 Tax=Talaromyces marneffei TaxID=37727 RepID=UPI0012A89637|nr:uncharacterized protein EYB26_001623 [Talaromyces marneffei]QGA13971.1 hypothetical protein EYB26_001623 [Talaromyces marneffei]
MNLAAEAPSETNALGEATAAHSNEKPPVTTGPSGMPSSDGTNPMWKLAVLLPLLLICMFLVALDKNIVSTAIPQITDEFHSAGDIGWYGSGYLLTSCGFQLLFGKVYTYFDIRTVFLASLFLFEAASAICGAAPNSTVFIVGRALAGVGAAGVFAGTIICIVYLFPLHRRPKAQGIFGAIFGIASIIGPLIGGGFTSNVTWRWCFYLNLPIGGVAFLACLLWLNVPNEPTVNLPLAEKIKRLDLIGTVLILPCLICLLLALQWGGTTDAWNSGRIIALLVVFAVTLLLYGASQAFRPDTASIPPRLYKNRSVLGGIAANFTSSAALYIYVYFLPLWFQTVKGVSAAASGNRLLPIMISMIIASITGGIFTTKVGYYSPLAVFGAMVMTIGGGLIYTFKVDTSTEMWIGYMILYGFGFGWSFQTPNLGIQASLPKEDVPSGLALNIFSGQFSQAIIVSVGANVFSTQVVRLLSWIPGFTAEQFTSGGATSLLSDLPVDQYNKALGDYNSALRQVFMVGLILCALTVPFLAAMEWLSVKKPAESEDELAMKATEQKPIESEDELVIKATEQNAPKE